MDRAVRAPVVVMPQPLVRRSNAAWMEALRGRGADCAGIVGELAAYLRRIIIKGTRAQIDAEDLDDIVHESLSRIVQALPTFRGDSAFTTWAAGVAIRVGFSEIRRRHARERLRDAYESIESEWRVDAGSDAMPPDETLSRAHLSRVLEHAIATQLSERQRMAILAELRGIPTAEIAARLGTNLNALYKLTHDARRKLRRALVEAGFSADSIHAHATDAP